MVGLFQCVRNRIGSAFFRKPHNSEQPKNLVSGRNSELSLPLISTEKYRFVLISGFDLLKKISAISSKTKVYQENSCGMNPT
jgi:hypothetical protein